jgi:hypothetical protein
VRHRPHGSPSRLRSLSATSLILLSSTCDSPMRVRSDSYFLSNGGLHQANPDYNMNERRYPYHLMLKGEVACRAARDGPLQEPHLRMTRVAMAL